MTLTSRGAGQHAQPEHRAERLAAARLEHLVGVEADHPLGVLAVRPRQQLLPLVILLEPAVEVGVLHRQLVLEADAGEVRLHRLDAAGVDPEVRLVDELRELVEVSGPPLVEAGAVALDQLAGDDHQRDASESVGWRNPCQV